MKNCENIIKRSIALVLFSDRCCLEDRIINGRAYSLEDRENQRQVIYNWLEKMEYDNYLTNEERKIFNTSIQTKPNLNIKMKLNIHETIEPLLWSIGFVTQLSDYDKYVRTDFHPILEIGVNHKLEGLIKKCNPKRDEEIVEQREVSMLWHWRARIGRQHLENNIDETILSIFGKDMEIYLNKIKLSKDFPKDFIALKKPYNSLSQTEVEKLEQIALWRHHTFEWITADEAWDDVDTST